MLKFIFDYTFVIYNYILKFLYGEMPSQIFSSLCTKSIGCKYHRKWETYRNYSNFNGFSNIELSNGSQNNQVNQVLCYLANNENIIKLMNKKCYNVKTIKELNDAKYFECAGINKNMGTKYIGIKIRDICGNLVCYNLIMTALIHELTHNDVSNHDYKFYDRQNELRKIYNDSTVNKIKWIDLI